MMRSDMGNLRVEADGISNLADVHRWMSDHRGQVVELDGHRRLALGLPISGARAVIVPTLLQDDAHPGPQLRGVLRALVSGDGRAPVKMVFDVASRGAFDHSTVREVGSDVLHSVSVLVAGSGPGTTEAA
jgi:hypothetical protein